MVSLSFPGSHIIYNRVSPYMIHAILYINLKAGFADDNAYLAFVIQGLCETGVRKDFIAISNN